MLYPPPTPNENRKYRDNVEAFVELIFFPHWFPCAFLYCLIWHTVNILFFSTALLRYNWHTISCIYLICTNWCFVRCFPHETITTIKITNISIPPPKFSSCPSGTFLPNLPTPPYTGTQPTNPLEISLYFLEFYISGVIQKVHFFPSAWYFTQCDYLEIYPCCYCIDSPFLLTE